ncbi:hypothetical protein DV735_g1657, partial [Chaetothyriales sp. CBS 134920]
MTTDLEGLNVSELGTKAYWDEYYKREDGNTRQEHDEVDDQKASTSLSRLESWFDDVGAPEKVLEFLLSPGFPLFSQEEKPKGTTAVLDLGTGNGSTLMSLAVEEDGAIEDARLVGVDYSEASIALARRLWTEIQDSGEAEVGKGTTVEFHVFDITRDTASSQPWWPSSSSSADPGGFDLVLDKGTFDAISLSSDTVDGRKVYEIYPSKVLGMVKPGGFFLITSCNWTEGEVVQRFCNENTARIEGTEARFEVFHKIKYPVYSFGGQQGQGVASVCFRRTD